MNHKKTEKRANECFYNFINTYNNCWSFVIGSYSISIIQIELERKNNKRKNHNVHFLYYFSLYNKYNLIDYEIKIFLFIFLLKKSFKNSSKILDGLV